MNPTASASGRGRDARWSLRLLGGFELSTLPDGQKVTSLGKRERVLLAYLALAPKGREQRRKLTTLLWGDAADETTLENLRHCLWSLRKSLGDSEHRVVASDGEDIVLDVASFDVDALVLRQIGAQSSRNELDRTAKLYNGGVLDGVDIASEEFESWRRSETARFRDQAVSVLNRLVLQLSEAGEIDGAIEASERILRLDPLHEPAVRRLMRLYSEDGRRSNAIQLYRELSDALKSDLDALPEVETRAVFADIVRGGQELASAPAPKAPSLSASVPSPNCVSPLSPPPQRIAPVGGAFRQATTGKRNWIMGGGVIAAVVAVFLALQFSAPAGTETAPSAADPSKAVSSTRVGAISIAVLPFANLSSDPEQEFFSDGITEEITSALARIPNLTVIGRTSAFQFKGQSQDLRAIGQALSAGYLIEGSVRRAGGRVRITAQLIRADSGAHLWAENYERDLTDIFAIQEEIAGAIAGALRILPALQQSDKEVRTVDARTYEYYLRAKALLRGRQLASGLQEILDVTKLLEQVVERNPDFAPAWATLAGVYDRIPVYSPAMRTGSASELRQLSDQYAAKAEDAAQRAIRLDPNLAEAYMSLAFQDVSRRNMTQALDNITKAMALDPTNPDVLAGYRNVLLEVGRVEEALAAQQRVVALEPFVPRFKMNLALNLWLVGQDDDAIEMLSGSAFNDGQVPLAMIYAAMERYDEAADTLMSLPPGLFPTAAVETAARLLRAAPSPGSSDGVPPLGALGFVYLHIGEPDRVVELYEARIESGYSGIAPLWHKAYEPVRRTERFKALVRRARLPEFWRTRGWPEFCRPISADDFVCS